MNNFSLDHKILIKVQLKFLTGGFFYDFNHRTVPLEFAKRADFMLYATVLVVTIK
jgi:hypothetical protein